MSLDPDDPRPPYAQVAERPREQIRSGELPPGARLPSRAELARRYGVAPMTVQSAVRVLRDRGLIVSRQGAGVFVRTRPADDTLTRAQQALDDLHAPIGDPPAQRCTECRDERGKPVPWPCRTHRQLAPVLADRAP